MMFTFAWRSEHHPHCKLHVSSIPETVPAALVPQTTHHSLAGLIDRKRNRTESRQEADLSLSPCRNREFEVGESSETFGDVESDFDDLEVVENKTKRCSNKRRKNPSDVSSRERGLDARQKGPCGWVKVAFDNSWHDFPSGWPYDVRDTYHRIQSGGRVSEPHERTNALQFCFNKIEVPVAYSHITKELGTWGNVHSIMRSYVTLRFPLRLHIHDWVTVPEESAFETGGG